MKRFASLLLALAMVFAMTTAAFAATTTDGKITVKNTVANTTYSIYRIFDLESYDENGHYAYKVSDKWADFFKDGAAGLSYVTIENGYVTWKTGAKAEEFAAAALAFAKTEGAVIEPEATKTSAADGSEVVFDNLPLGYYLVDSSLGALCALTTTQPTADVIEKNSTTVPDKEVKEGENWGGKNDANVGDTVEFKVTIKVQGSATKYVLHDQMDDGLTYDKVTSVTLNGSEVDNTDNKNYVVTTDTSDGCTFEVQFTDAFCAALKSGDEIVVSYQATLNENAVAGEAEQNKAYLSFKDSNNVTHETTTTTTETYTWNFKVFKYTGTETKTPLAGAKFSLYTDAACTEANIVKFTEVEGKDNTYRYDKDGTVTEITTTEDGKFTLTGLDSGTYYLKETAAPAGYNQLAAPVKVVIDENGNVSSAIGSADLVTSTDKEVGVLNQTGAELPSTGGMGTTLFYVLGGILVAGAAILLVVKRRMNGAER